MQWKRELIISSVLVGPRQFTCGASVLEGTGSVGEVVGGETGSTVEGEGDGQVRSREHKSVGTTPTTPPSSSPAAPPSWEVTGVSTAPTFFITVLRSRRNAASGMI